MRVSLLLAIEKRVNIYIRLLARYMDLPALACTSNLHEPHQNKNQSLNVKTQS